MNKFLLTFNFLSVVGMEGNIPTTRGNLNCNINDQKFSLNITPLIPGIYTIGVRTDSMLMFEKFIKSE